MATRRPNTDGLPAMVVLTAADGQTVGLRGECIRDVRVEWFERSPGFKALLTAEALESGRPIYVPGLAGLPMTIKHLERLVSYYECGAVTGLQTLTLAEILGFGMLAQRYDGTYISRNHCASLKQQTLDTLSRLLKYNTSNEFQALLPIPEDQRFSRDEQQAVDITLAWTVNQRAPDDGEDD